MATKTERPRTLTKEEKNDVLRDIKDDDCLAVLSAGFDIDEAARQWIEDEQGCSNYVEIAESMGWEWQEAAKKWLAKQ
jgi:hypothetical protein